MTHPAPPTPSIRPTRRPAPSGCIRVPEGCGDPEAYRATYERLALRRNQAMCVRGTRRWAVRMLARIDERRLARLARSGR